MKKVLSLFVFSLFLFIDMGWSAEYSIDNTNDLCNNCSRRELDSLNAYHRNTIRVNQVGYRPQDQHKFSFVVTPDVTIFQVINVDNGLEVFSGTLEDLGVQPGGGIHIRGTFNSINSVYEFGDTTTTATEHLYRADFSDLSAEGIYRVVVGSDTSSLFRIDDKIYNYVFETALKFFGIQRCGDTDSWMHKACHLKDGSAIGHDLTGGWHDCGDHFKVSETIGYSALVLSLTYALWPEKAEDFYGSSYNDTLPFGTDGIPDVLRETKVGADYIYKLYLASKTDGLIASADMYHSVGVDGSDHAYWGKPENQDAQPASKGGPDRVVASGAGANVSGMFAATLAFFSVGWEMFDPAYALELRNAAIDIYDNVVMKNLNGNTSGLAGFYPGSGRLDDDGAAAALALWYATKDQRFRYDLIENPAIESNSTHMYNDGLFPAGHMGAGRGFHHGGWTTDYEQVHSFVLYAFAKLILKDETTAATYGVNPTVRDSLMEDVVACMAKSINDGAKGNTNYTSTTVPSATLSYDAPYGGVFTSVEWGFNRYNLGMVNELFMFWDLTGEQKYFDVALDNINYNLGLNPWDISFVMGAGSRNLQHPHNRTANPDGYNAGGIPYEYRCPKGAFMGGIQPGGILNDDWEKYVVTETCIDFSAQLLFPSQMLAKDLPPDTQGPAIGNVVIEYVDQSTAMISWQTDELSSDSLYLSLSPGGEIIAGIYAGALSKSKAVKIDGLSSKTTYYFYITGTDIRRNVSIEDNHGEWYEFKTTDTVLPPAVLTDVRICNITENSATVYWWTPNGNYSSMVEYGETESLGSSVNSDDSGLPGMFHQVTITNLNPATTYYVKAISAGGESAILSFSTTEVYIDYTIMIKPTSKKGASAHFYMEIANNENVPYTGVELRWYYKLKTKSPSNLTIKGFDNQLFVVSGIPGSGAVTFGAPIQMAAPYDEWWYIPIDYPGELPVDGRLRIEMEIHDGDWGDMPWDELEDSWSLIPHDYPVVSTGVDFDLAQYFPGVEYIETVNGVKVLSYTRTSYVTAHYKGEHIYGYPPDYLENMPKSHKMVNMLFQEPFASPATNLETEDKDVDFKGLAWAYPDGNLSNVEIGNLGLGVTEADLTYLKAGYLDSVSFKKDAIVLEYGANAYTVVAWHNRDGEDCACNVLRTNIEQDSLTVAREKRVIVLDPDSLVAYQSKYSLVKVKLTDDSGNLITNEDISLELSANDLGMLFFATKGSDVAMTRVTLVGGVAEFYVYSDKVFNGIVSVSAENPLGQYRYIPGILKVDVQERPPWPLIESANIYDNNCDLIPDEIRITLSETFNSGQSPVRIDFEDYQGGFSANVESTPAGLELVVELPENLLADGAPKGQVSMVISIDGKEEIITEDFGDKIGPQLLSVSLLEQVDPNQTSDTLFVEFSERIVSPGTLWLFNVYDTDDKLVAEEATVINSKEYDAEQNIWMIVVQSASATQAQPIKEGVKVQLKQASEATIMDVSKNIQSACDFTKHDVTIKYRPVPIERGEILDTDEDGFAETLVLYYTRALDDKHKPDSVSAVFGLFFPETLTVADYSLSEESTVLTAIFEPPFQLGNTAGEFEGVYKGTPITAGGMGIQYVGIGAAFEINEKVVSDKVGPVITSANFREGKVYDTLYISLSEPVNIRDDATFNLALKVKGDKVEIFEPIAWILTTDEVVQIKCIYDKDAPGYLTVGDMVKLPDINSIMIDKQNNLPAKNNPPVTIRGTREAKMEVDLEMESNITRIDPTKIKDAYGNFYPKDDEHFRITVLNTQTGKEVFYKDGELDINNSIDSSALTHIGPTFILKLGVPRGTGVSEDPMWDSLVVNLDIKVFDNLGQYVNDFKSDFVIVNGDYLNLNDEIEIVIEWTAHQDKGVVSENGRSVGTGAYIGLVNTTAELITDLTVDTSVDDYLNFNRKQKFSDKIKFGYIR